jgi:hypothetical protein
MISSKFRRNEGRRQSWNLGSIQSTNRLQILVSSRDHKIGECYPGQEEEILGIELSVVLVEPRDTTPMSVRSLESF